MKTTWSVLVIFDTAQSRERAVEVCDHLVERYWARSELEVSWWSCEMLGVRQRMADALSKGIHADLLIFALEPRSDLPRALDEWLEIWLKQRGDREGALLDLIAPDAEGAEAAHLRLRQSAHRAGMDYLTHEPETQWWSIPDSLESFTARAEQMTSVLDEILRKQTPPPALIIQGH